MPTFKIEARAFASALTKAGSIGTSPSETPLESVAIIDVFEEKIAVTRTNLVTQIEISVELEKPASRTGQFAVDAKRLGTILRACGKGEISVHVRPNVGGEATVMFTDAFSEFFLPVQSIEGLPIQPFNAGAMVDAFEAGELSRLAEIAMPFIGKELTRYYLSGIHWKSEGEGKAARLVATSGHQLIKIQLDHDHPMGSAPIDMIIPIDAWRGVVKTMKSEIVGVYQWVGKENELARLMLTTPSVKILTLPIDGTYPDINRVWPKEEAVNHRVTFSALSLFNHLDRIATYMKGKTKAVKMERTAASQVDLTASCGNDVVRSHTDADWPEGMPPIAVNVEYFRDIVRGCDTTVTMHIIDPAAPILITDDTKHIARILMPMRT